MIKKILIGLVLTASLMANPDYENIPQDFKNSMREWVLKKYDLETYGASIQRMMYESEMDAFLEIARIDSLDEGNIEVIQRVMRQYPLEEWGWQTVLMMTKEELKNINW